MNFLRSFAPMKALLPLIAPERAIERLSRD